MKRRIVATAALAMGLAFGVSGCGLVTPQMVKVYPASDGVDGMTGDIAIRNAMLISKNGDAGNLVVTLVNSGSRSHRVLVQYGSGTTHDNYVTVGAKDTLTLGPVDSKRIIFRSMSAKVGGLLPVYFQYATEPGVRLVVPVLSPRQPQYADLAPSGR